MRTFHTLHVFRRIFKMDRQRPSSPESEDPAGAPSKSKSKLGVFKSSFRTVGRGGGKNQEGDVATLKDKKKIKKLKDKDKGKVKEKPKAAEASSEDAEGSVTEGSESPPTKTPRTSKATTLVRKLSIGKYKVGVSGGGKTPTPPPEESPKTSKSDVSSDAGGRQAPEGEDDHNAEAPPPRAVVADQSEPDAVESQSPPDVTQRAEPLVVEHDDAIPEETPEQEVALGQQLETLLELKLEPQPEPEDQPPVEVDVQISVSQLEVATKEDEAVPEPQPEPPAQPPVEVEVLIKEDEAVVEPPMADLVPEEAPQDIVLAPGPSLKSEIQTAEKLVEAERSAIGDAIAEARSRLSHSLETAQAQQVPEKREHLYKILVIGELGTGKTSIIKRYVHQFFSQHYRATIGVDFALKVLNWDANTIIRLQLWDIAGQERFGNMTRVYYKEAVGAFVVFDVTRAATFDAVFKWKQDLDSKVTLPDGSPIPCVLLANKCDQQKEGIVNNAAKMDEYCKEKGFSAWFETSAKENINIEEAARSLVKKILQNDKLINQNDLAKDAEKINLDGNAGDGKSGSRCSC